MRPTENSGSTKPEPTTSLLRSFGSLLKGFGSLVQSPFHRTAPSPPPTEPLKRSREEAFSIAPTDLGPSAHAPPAQAPAGLDPADDAKQTKKPNLGARLADLKQGLQAGQRQALDSEPSREGRPGIVQEGARNMSNGMAVMGVHAMQQGLGHAEHRESALQPKALPFESPRQQQAPTAAFQQQLQQQRGGLPMHHHQPQRNIFQTPRPTPAAQQYVPGSSRPTFVTSSYSPMPSAMQLSALQRSAMQLSPMHPSMHSFKQPQGRPTSILRNAYNLQTSELSLVLYKQMIQDASKNKPLPQAPKFYETVDLVTEADAELQKAAEAGLRRKATAAKIEQNMGEQSLLLEQMHLSSSLPQQQSLQEATAKSQSIEREMALVQDKRAASHARRQEEAERIRQLQEARRKQEAAAAAAAAREADERRVREQQKPAAAAAAVAAAAAAAKQKKKPKKQPKDEEEEAILIESSDDEDAAPAPKGRQGAPSMAVAAKRSPKPGRQQQEGFGATPEETETWRRVFDQGSPQEMLIDYCNIQIPRNKLFCMNMRQWLNDEAINLYMLLLQERDTALRSLSPQPGAAPRCHFFNSYFLAKLYRDRGKYEYKQVQRWTSAKKLQTARQASPNLLEVDRIVMPVNCSNVHWTCCMIDLKRQEFVYYDSMLGKDPELLNNLARYLEDEAKDKCNGRVLDTSSWKKVYNPGEVPTQKNGFDCGVFTIMFADRLGLGLPFDFTQSDMEDIRIKVLHRLVSNKIPP